MVESEVSPIYYGPSHLIDRLGASDRFPPSESSTVKHRQLSLRHVLPGDSCRLWSALTTLILCCTVTHRLHATDPYAELQRLSVLSKKVSKAKKEGDSPVVTHQWDESRWGHWGPNPNKYSSWTTHSNRLVPIYTFGGNLQAVTGENSVYRREDGLKQLYGKLPEGTLNPQANYADQTDVFRLQQSAIRSGKKRVVLFVFDGMDWQTTRAAAIAKSQAVTYDAGRGSGLLFQDYRGCETDFGFFVSSPHNDGTNIDVNKQHVTNPGGKTPGGYCFVRGGPTPWGRGNAAGVSGADQADAKYLIAAAKSRKHAYTDSASSATSMTSGIKTYNNAINVDFAGREVLPLARTLQAEGFAVGAVTSVPISHATPACAYANNVHRSDYQDITRDMLGVPSIAHPGGLSGLDVAIGAGWGVEVEKDGAQGENFVAGNKYLTAADQARISLENGGQYVVAERTQGKAGAELLRQAASKAVAGRHRLFGFFGVAGGHLPYQTADGGYNPTISVGNPLPAKAEVYSDADVSENPVLADMAVAALDVLDARSDRWWLMVEAGDVDWANHSNNIDNSIGAVLSGENAFHRVVKWIESNGGWEDTYLVLTADHGHYLVINRPELLVPSTAAPRNK